MTQPKFFTGAPAVHRHASRRLFMRQASALSMLAGAGAPLALNLLAAGSAAAQGASGYKAIVCLFMFGGNDSFNTVLATDPASWAAYSKMRPDGSIGLRRPGVLEIPSASAGSPDRLGGVLPINPINPQGRAYALHPLLGNTRTLFTQQRLAILANIGPLEVPTNKAQLADLAHRRPPRLFSHNDQQSVWQTMQPEGATVGWGGRMADLIESANNRSTFTAISAAGNAVWLSGEEVRQYQVSGAGAQRLGAELNQSLYGSKDLPAALHKLVGSSDSGHVFEDRIAKVSQRSIDAEGYLSRNLLAASNDQFGTPTATAYNPALDPKLQYLNPLSGAKEFSPLAHQLQVVARLIEAGKRAPLDYPKRQVFFVSLGGFDTHSRQNQTHADLMARLDHALSYFDTALDRVSAREMVTTFTASDFGRSFTSNGDGTDHGWGAHQFVMGGAVKGGDLYGSFPTLVASTSNSNDFTSPDQVRNGALLPSTSVDQLGGSLGRWFGLSEGQLTTVFPNLAGFNTAPSNMKFFG